MSLQTSPTMNQSQSDNSLQTSDLLTVNDVAEMCFVSQSPGFMIGARANGHSTVCREFALGNIGDTVTRM